MVSFTKKDRNDLLVNYVETINQLKLRDEYWKSITTNKEYPYESIPDDIKKMIAKHHRRECLFYKTQRDMYLAISKGDTQRLDIMRTALLHYARGVMDDMLETEEYDESFYIDVCDGFKNKIETMDTWINAVK